MLRLAIAAVMAGAAAEVAWGQQVIWRVDNAIDYNASTDDQQCNQEARVLIRSGSATTGGGLNGAVIIRTTADPSHVGRWVAVHHKAVQVNQEVIGHRPRAVRSPDGQTWVNSASPQDATVPCTPPCPQQREPISWDLRHVFLPVGGPFVYNASSLAADPANESKMYMAFIGATPSTGSANIDLFVARSTDGGQNFTGNPEFPFLEQPGDRVLHLRDEDLGDQVGSIQFLPSIAVDAMGLNPERQGGVGITYYVAWPVQRPPNPVLWKYKVKFAYIGDFRVFPHPSIWTVDLTPVCDLEEDPLPAPGMVQQTFTRTEGNE